MVVSIVVVASALGLTLIVIGLRGRRIDNHPLCAQCGFDLIGRSIGRHRCPECGADVSGLAVRVGHRVRRAGSLYAGAMLSLPALLIITVAGYVHVRGIDVTPHKPGWWLVYELDAGGDVEATAFVELCRRFQKNELSDARIADVADYCLSRQANRSIPWNRAWGSYIETARMNGKLSDERWGRYATGSFRVTMPEPPMRHVGSSLPLQIRVERSRVTGSTFGARVSWSDVSIDGIPIETPELKLLDTSNHRRGNVQYVAIYVAEISGDVTRGLPSGEREIRASLMLTIDDGDARHPSVGRYRYDVRATCQFESTIVSRAATR